MAIITFKCDTCKREIDVQQNPKGLETIHKCTITLGCRGKLYVSKKSIDFLRGHLPPSKEGLDDWQPRKALYNHIQTISKNEWIITHGLNSNPNIIVYVDTSIGTIEEIIPQEQILIDSNSSKLIFDKAYTGIAQCISRQTDPNLLIPVTEYISPSSDTCQLSYSGEVILAIRDPSIVIPSTVGIELTFTNPSGEVFVHQYTADVQLSSSSPWYDVSRVTINGRIYSIRGFNILISQIQTGVIFNGALITFSGINTGSGWNPLDENVLLLTANEPYSTYDKSFDEIVIPNQLPTTSLFLSSSELSGYTTVCTMIYPHIKVV